MSKHSPGPWRAVKVEYLGTEYWSVEADDDWIVTCTNDGDHAEVNDRYVHLIAEAPAMLELLREYIRAIGVDALDALDDRALAILKRIEGK